MASLTRADDAARVSSRPVIVEDHLEPRVRIPADLLRCVISAVEIAALVGLGLLAKQTATGLNVDIIGVSHKLPGGLLRLIGTLGSLALLVLPVALAVRLCLVRQFRRLGEAIVTGGIAVGVVALLNLLLSVPALSHLHSALHAAAAGGNRGPALDGYLAGLVAYVTVIGLRGRAHWRPAFLTAIAFYGLANLAVSHTTLLSLLITVLTGSAIGSGLRYALGTISGRPTAADIAAALDSVQAPIAAMRRIVDGSTEVRRYAATTANGRSLDVTVFDRDQQAADAFYRLYRRVRVRAQVSRSAPLTLEGAVERHALLTYATEDAGVLTPRLHAVLRVGPDAAVLATDHLDGRTLADLGKTTTDGDLRRVWDTVLRLHEHRITHRALTADRIMAMPDGHQHSRTVALLEPGNGDVAATDLQLRLDRAQLLAQTALLVGPERAADLAIEKLDRQELPDLVPLLQPVALHRTTRAALRGRKDVLAELRKRLLAVTPGAEVPPVQIERIRPRTVLTLVAGVFAAYLLAGQLADVSFSKLLAEANLGWSVLALGLSVLTYVGATLALSGFVLERLNPLRTFLVQVAGSFVTLVTPAAVGGVALNVRYLRRAKLNATDAASSVGVTQALSFLIYFVLLFITATITGTSHANPLHQPGWVYIVLGALAGIALIVLALPAGRRLVLSRLGSAIGQVVPRLLDVAQRPVKLAQGIGGALLLTFAYISCLAASVAALGGPVPPLASVAVVYLTGSAVGSFLPTPGGLGFVEAALTSTLIAAGVPGHKAVPAVLLFRTVTFWLPVPAGWAALHFLQRKDVL